MSQDQHISYTINRFLANADGSHDIDCKMNCVGSMKMKSEFFKIIWREVGTESILVPDGYFDSSAFAGVVAANVDIASNLDEPPHVKSG